MDLLWCLREAALHLVVEAQEEAHGVEGNLRVVGEIVAVDVQHDGRVGQHGGHPRLRSSQNGYCSAISHQSSMVSNHSSAVSNGCTSLSSSGVRTQQKCTRRARTWTYQDVHGTGLEVVLVPGALLPGDVDETWDSVSVPCLAAVPQDLHSFGRRTWPGHT